MSDIRQALNKKIAREVEGFKNRLMSAGSVIDVLSPAILAEDDKIERQRYRSVIIAAMENGYAPRDMGDYLEDRLPRFFGYWKEEFAS